MPVVTNPQPPQSTVTLNQPLGINWKTTAGGVAAVLTALGTALAAYQKGNLDANMIIAVLTAVIAAWIGFNAKDNNVTGGTKVQ